MEPLKAKDARRYAEFQEWTPYEAALLLAGCKPLPRGHVPEPDGNTPAFNLIHAVQICGPSKDLQTSHPPEVWVNWYSEYFASRDAPEFSQMALRAVERYMIGTTGITSKQYPLAIKDLAALQDATFPLAVPVQAGSEGPAPATKGSKKRRTWRDVAMPYVVETYRAGKYRTAHVFYVDLVNRADTQNSPFTQRDRELFLTEIGQSVSKKTIENAMPQIKAAAALKNRT